MEKETVLIAGAGPTGLTLANLLAKLRIPFLLIDKSAEPSLDSKAFGIHARSLEIFDQIGIAEKAINEGSIDNTVHILIKGKEAVKINLNNILPGETKFPHLLILQQNKTEKLLLKALENEGHKIHWRHELTDITQHTDYVEVTIKTDKDTETKRRFTYAIGCDGAGSTVREKTGFRFKGKTFSQTFYLADCELEWEYPHSHIYFILSPGYVTAIFSFREKNRYRIFNFLNNAVNTGEDAPLDLEDVQKILDDDPNLIIKARNMNWSSVFKIHSRFTEHFSKGRIFLAGDSAHVHSPAAAQGMNTGIQDAYNLAWKLSLVLTKKAKPGLLDTYNEERQEIATNLHNTTDKLFSFMVNQNRVVNYIRLYILPKIAMLLFRIKWFRKRNLRRFSQLSIKYRFSSLNHNGRGTNFSKNAPKPGDRAPFCALTSQSSHAHTYQLLSYNHFTLLIASADKNILETSEAEKFCNSCTRLPVKFYALNPGQEKAFADAYGIKKEAVFIIRPDGHICFRSSKINLQEIKNYFDNLILPTPNQTGNTIT